MTILIKNIQLIDGTGKPAFKADILIKKEKIHAIGNFSQYRANETIDGMAAYLSPGFININNESDHHLTLFSEHSQKDFLLKGTTTIIGGHGGVSLAPLIYGSLESIKEWSDIRKINVNWRTVAEFLKVMERRRLGVNFGTLVGHWTIRQALTGGASGASRDLSRNELRVFNHILEKALKEGAFGFSTGLNYIHSNQTSYNEIKALVEICAKYKGLYSTHLRDGKRGLLSSVNEIINIAKETGVKVLINDFRPIIGCEKDYGEALELINKNTDKADIYLSNKQGGILIYELLPEWAKRSGYEAILKDIQAPGLREKILKELPRIKGEEIIILNAPSNEYLIGKSLKEFAQNRDLTFGEGLLELMKITNFRATVSYENISLKKIKEEIIPIEKKIYKMTGLPAVKLGLKNRGIIREGNFADLVMFRDAEIREVILNGKRVVKDGKFQNVLEGKILRKYKF